VLEESVWQARANEAVAKARVSLLRWELKALQLRASVLVEAVGASVPVEAVAEAPAAEVPRAAERDW